MIPHRFERNHNHVPRPTSSPEPSTAVLSAPTPDENSGDEAPRGADSETCPYIDPAHYHPPPDPSIPVHLRHIDQKRLMLELINEERTRAGLNPVTMGDNAAAQLHAEAALEGCFSSHWGLHGLKPYMRYSLAGGYQSSGETYKAATIASPMLTTTVPSPTSKTRCARRWWVG